MNTYENAQLDALGDATRRAILARLLDDGPLSVGELAGDFHVSRPAVSQHLKVLTRAKLVRCEAAGTRRVYELDPNGFQMVQAYFAQFWTLALAAFKRKVEDGRPSRAPVAGKKRKH